MSEDDVVCPACAEHSQDETLGAYGIVHAGALAIIKGDWQKVKDTYSTLTPYDAHIAITFYALALIDLCSVAGADVEEMLDSYLGHIREAFAEGQP